MAGQLFKRGDSWQVRIFLGKDANGKRKYYNKIIHGTKRDAQHFLTAKLREKDLGTFIQPTSIYLNDFLKQWLNEVSKQKVCEKTFNNYVSLVKCHTQESIGLKKLCDLQAYEIQKLYNDLKNEEYSSKTIKHIHNVLSSTLKQAVKWKMLIQNPCDLCELPRQEKNEMKYLSPEETTKFLEVAKADKHFLIFLLAIETGMRPGEYLGLQWKDLDNENKTISVRRAVFIRKGGGFIFTEPKTNKSRRSIPISNSLLKALKAHRRKQLEERLKLGEKYQNHDLIFASEIGTPLLHRNLARRHFKQIIEDAELPEIRLYDLRHTTATLLLSAGANPKVVSERLGHSSIVLTMDVYSHVLPSMQKDATDTMEKIMKKR